MALMTLEAQFVAIFQLLLAALLSGLIGIDRERHATTAGFRTHMLVGVGACLISVLSVAVFPNDPARLTAQIVVGIGFLGGGTIIKEGASVQGLTTAANIWATAAIGMAVGLGAWLIAIVATIMIWIILAIFVRLEFEKRNR
ncbi:MAG: MgtC/SapB family protein [Anaerolineae bacterium]|nr:MgtC/SapB family protein [Anaerolineae bacterium]